MPQRVVIDKTKLKDTLVEIEKNKKFGTRQELYQELATKFGTSTTTISSRLKKFNLLDVVQTPLGKKGSGLLGGPRKKGPRSDKFSSPEAKKHIAAIKKNISSSMHPTVDKLAKGSLKAAIKLKCWDCSGEQKTEIKYCEVTDCSLWNFRPYK